MNASDDIREALAAAAVADGQARQWRRTAGRLLADMREEAPGPAWLAALDDFGLDLRTALMLIQEHAGGREAMTG